MCKLNEDFVMYKKLSVAVLASIAFAVGYSLNNIAEYKTCGCGYGKNYFKFFRYQKLKVRAANKVKGNAKDS